MLMVACLKFIDLVLYTFSISKEHAIISMDGENVSIKAASPGAKIKVNGILMAGDSMQLKHHDRLLFGKISLIIALLTMSF